MNGLLEVFIVLIAISFMMARQAPRTLWISVLGAALAWWSLANTPAA